MQKNTNDISDEAKYIEWSDVFKHMSYVVNDVKFFAKYYQDRKITRMNKSIAYLRQLAEKCVQVVEIINTFLVSKGESPVVVHIDTSYHNDVETDSNMQVVETLVNQLSNELNTESVNPLVSTSHVTVQTSRSIYAIDSSLYYLDIIGDNTAHFKKNFYRLLDSIHRDISCLFDYMHQYTEDNKHFALYLFAITLKNWFAKRCDPNRYKCSITSFYKLYLDVFIIQFAKLCVESDVFTRFNVLTAFDSELSDWADRGGSLPLSQVPFENDHKGLLPNYMMQYNINTASYSPSDSIRAEFTVEVATVAVYLEETIKPILLESSIKSLSKITKSNDKYLHSISDNVYRLFQFDIRDVKFEDVESNLFVRSY